jgi:phosphate transport system substrate-binding protein
MTHLLYLSLFTISLIVLNRCFLAGSLAPPIIEGADDPITTLFIRDVMSAYQLQSPNVNIVVQTGSSMFNENLMFTNSVDFSITSSTLTSVQMAVNPTVISLPFLGTAIVPIYRLDSLTTLGPAVVFSGSILAQIYLGNITMWNDPQLQKINHDIVLPNKTITVVVDTSVTDTNRVFADALCKFDSLACNIISFSVQPQWPVLNYSAYVTTKGSVGVTATVITLDNSIGYTTLAIALDNLASVGSMVNKGGDIIHPASESVSFALLELATGSTVNGVNLNDASSTSAWPINVMSYVLINTQYSRDTCAIRQASVEFLLFIYQSTVVAKVANGREYAVIPNLLMTVFDIINLLMSVQCDGQPVVTKNSILQIVIGGTNRLAFVTNMLTNLYNVPTDPTEYTYTPLTSQVAWDKFTNAELDAAIFYQNELSAPVQSSTDYLVIPLFLTSITPIFNSEIIPGVIFSSLTIDLGTYFRILFLNITHWNDPAILKYNPTLAFQLGSQSSPITLIEGCVSTPTITQIFHWAQTYGMAYDPALMALLIGIGSNTALLAAFNTCSPPTGYNIIYTPNEATISSIVSTVVGSIGYTQDTGSISNGKFILMYPSGTQSVEATPNADGLLACTTDTFSSTTLAINSQSSSNPACWPFTIVAYLAVRTSYSSTAGDSSGCTRGLKTLQFAQWLMTTTLLDTATVSLMSPRPSTEIDIKTAIINALNTVTCDGSTMLITWPVVWSLALAANVFGMLMSALGLVGIIISLGLVIRYRTLPVMRSASPVFVCTSLLGVALMLISVFFWVSKATMANCNAFSWCINLGFMLTFAPLFAKTWRIYRIFGRKKLSVIKINNRKLASMIFVFIVIEIIILSTWQGVSPLQPVLNIQTTGSPPVDNDYTQCGIVGSGGTAFLIIIGLTKGGLLVYGALLAFSTRRVTEHFNESQTIAWAIYNVVFSGGIVGVIIGLLSPVGDILILLPLLVVLWISYFTALVIMVPKAMGLFSPLNNLNSAELSGAKSSIGGFSFLSVTEMLQPTLLHQYEAALQQQLILVRNKLQHLSAAKTGIKPKDSAPRTSTVREASESKILTRPPRTSNTPESTPVLVPRAKSKYIVAAAMSASLDAASALNNRGAECPVTEGLVFEPRRSSREEQSPSPTGSASSLLPNQIEG